MYTLPLNFDLNSFKNVPIIQISFSINSINVFFDNGNFISINYSFAFTLKERRIFFEELYPINDDFNLLNLLEKRAINILIDDKRKCLTLHFEDNLILELIGDDNYESYILNVNKKEIII